jgi:hypothetical protein
MLVWILCLTPLILELASYPIGVRHPSVERNPRLYEKWGVAGVKIDFMNRDDQDMVNWYEKIAIRLQSLPFAYSGHKKSASAGPCVIPDSRRAPRMAGFFASNAEFGSTGWKMAHCLSGGEVGVNDGSDDEDGC